MPEHRCEVHDEVVGEIKRRLDQIEITTGRIWDRLNGRPGWIALTIISLLSGALGIAATLLTLIPRKP